MTGGGGTAAATGTTVGAALREAERRLREAGVPSPAFDARLLLRAAAGWTAAELLAEGRSRLAPGARAAFGRLVAGRAARRPLQHLTGTVEFHGLPLAVGPEALVPRPETEILVEAALEFARETGPPRRIADVGCGAGPIALALAAGLPQSFATGFDNDPAALRLAARNRRANGLDDRVALARADLLTAARPGAFRVIAANLPYVPTAEIGTLEPEVRDHEPRHALDGGPDGLDPLRRLLPGARRALEPGGRLFLEIGAGQREAAARLLSAAGFRPVAAIPDLAGIPRVLAAEPGPEAAPGARIGSFP